MRLSIKLFLLTALLAISNSQLFAYDIAVENSDGVTIYYNLINEETELEVVHRDYTYNSYSGSVVIPEEVAFQGVTRKVKSIGRGAFLACQNLTSITIPGSVTTIGEDAFLVCDGLKKVIVMDIAAWCAIDFGPCSNPLFYARHIYSDENTEITDLVISDNVTTIRSTAFESCAGLTSVTIPESVTSIGDSAFGGCTGLTSVTIPNSVTTIGEYAFSRCTGLTSVSIPDGLTSIEGSLFSNCSGLTSITIPGSVKSIGEGAFNNCSALTSITIPGSVTSIGDMAFNNCSGLTSITIPGSVTTIGDGAFARVDLASVISEKEKPVAISLFTFSQNTLMNATLYVPKGTKGSYLATGDWYHFAHIKEMEGDIPDGIGQSTNETAGTAPVYNLKGQRVNEHEKGIVIKNGKKVVMK